MLQSLTMLLFGAVAFVAAGLIAALVAQDWAAMRAALGLNYSRALIPLPPRTRLVALRRVPVLRVTPAALRRAA